MQSPVTAQDARDRIDAIAAGTIVPVDALEPALRVLLEVSGASAGAVCLYDPADATLRLGASAGLSENGRRLLAFAQRATPGAWAAPFIALLDRRAHVSQQGAGPLPRLVDPQDAVAAVACVPVCAGETPLACLVLVAVEPTGLERATLDALEPAVHALAGIVHGLQHPRPLGTMVDPQQAPSILEAIAAQAVGIAPVLRDIMGGRVAAESAAAAVANAAGTPASIARGPSSLLEVVADTTLRRLPPVVRDLAGVLGIRVSAGARSPGGPAPAATDQASRDRQMAALLETLSSTEAERDRLSTELQHANAERAELALAQVALEQARVAEVAGLMTRLSDGEAAVARSLGRVHELERAHEQLAAALAEAVARERHTRDDLHALTERSAADREETLRRARETTRSAEEARAAAAGEAEELRSALAEAEARVLDAEDRVRRERTTLQELDATLQGVRVERERLQRDLDEARAREGSISAEQEMLERELARVRTEQAEAEVRLREAERRASGDWGARLADAETVIAFEREHVAELERVRERLTAELTDATAREQRLRDELQSLAERTAADREEMLRRAQQSTRAAEEARAAAAAETEAVRASLAQAQSVLLEAEDQARQARDGVTGLEAELLAIRAERDQTARELDELRTDRAAAVASASSDADVEARARVAELERAHQAVSEALADVTAREHAVRDELRALADRCAADREEILARARETTRIAEEARVAAAAEAEGVRTQLAESQAGLLAAENLARQARHELAELEAAVQGAQADRDRLTRELAEARERESAGGAELARLECEVGRLAEERSHLQLRNREREAELAAEWAGRQLQAESALARERGRVQDLEQARERLAAELAEASAREQRARDELQGLVERTAVDREDMLRRAHQSTRGSEEARAAAAAEAESVRTALAQAQTLIMDAEDQARQARHAAETLDAAVEGLRGDRDRLQVDLEAARAREAEASARVSQLEREVAFLNEERTRLSAVALTAHQQVFASDRPARPASPPAASGGAPRKPAAAAAADTGPQKLAVIDVPANWADAGLGEQGVLLVPADGDVAGQLAADGTTEVLVNLAAPGAVQALAALRAAGSAIRCWGALVLPGTGKALRLGGVEVASGPLDREALAGVIASRAPQGARVLAAGAASVAETFIALRQLLTRQGLSVSIAWDGKQAGDLLSLVRPQMVVVDLGLPPRDAYTFVAGLATCQPAPEMVLLPREDDPAAGFTQAIADLLQAPHAMGQKQLIMALQQRKVKSGTKS